MSLGTVVEQQKQRQRGGDDGEAEGITKKFDHRSENWMKFDTFSSFWNIIQRPRLLLLVQQSVVGSSLHCFCERTNLNKSIVVVEWIEQEFL